MIINYLNVFLSLENKKIMKFLCVLLMVFTGGLSNAGAINGEKQVTQMLTEFYTGYCKIWSIRPFPSTNELTKKIDPLLNKYCTSKLRREAKRWLDDGRDLLTNDRGIDIASLKSMVIVKDSSKENIYRISYVVETYPTSPNVPVKKMITLNIGIQKEAGSYRIGSVKEIGN